MVSELYRLIALSHVGRLRHGIVTKLYTGIFQNSLTIERLPALIAAAMIRPDHGSTFPWLI